MVDPLRGGPAVAELRRTLLAHRARLLAIPGVLYISIGHKVVAGRASRRLAIRVYVRRKRRVSREARIPVRLRAVERGGGRLRHFVATDVAAAPRSFRALVLRGGSPIEGWTRGRAGLVYRTHAGERVALTNAHVVAGLGSRGIGQPVYARRGDARVVAGRVRRSSLLREDVQNPADAALFAVRGAATELAIGAETDRVIGVGRVRAASAERFFYARAGERVELRDPEPILTPVSVRVQGRSLRFRGCVQMRVAGGFARAGDSGSLVVKRGDGGWLGCGLLFAGAGGRVLIYPLAPALRALGRPLASDAALAEDVSIAFSATLG